MPEAHQRYLPRWDPDYFRRQATATGISTSQYIDKLLLNKQFSEQAFLV